MKKIKRLLLNMDMDLYVKVEKKAKLENKNVTQLIRGVLDEYVKTLTTKQTEDENLKALKEIFDLEGFGESSH